MLFRSDEPSRAEQLDQLGADFENGQIFEQLVDKCQLVRSRNEPTCDFSGIGPAQVDAVCHVRAVVEIIGTAFVADRE